MIVVEDLRKTFRDRGRGAVVAVDGLSFRVRAGEVYGLLGPNGAGKTTTLRILATLLDADSGTVRIVDLDARRRPLDVRRRIAYVPAEAGLPERLTPREVVRLFAAVQSVDTPNERTELLLGQLGASKYADTPCGDLSTGMKRRVVLARALVHDPRVLLLDEPTDGLDVPGRRDVLALVRRLAAEGRAVVVSSHIMAEVERVADRVGVVLDGRMAAEGTLSELLARSGARDLDAAFLALVEPSA